MRGYLRLLTAIPKGRMTMKYVISAIVVLAVIAGVALWLFVKGMEKV